MTRKVIRAAAVLLLLAVFAVAGLWVRDRGFKLIRISGTSMNNTLMSGDVALVTRWDSRDGRAPELYDVVECRFPGRGDTYVKRVMGLPGNAVALRGGKLTIDDFPVSEPYVSSVSEDFEVTLGEGEYLLLGDNRADSYDSRMPDVGPVGGAAFLGKVRFIVWPLRRLGPVE